jgi:hypothetical protein
LVGFRSVFPASTTGRSREKCPLTHPERDKILGERRVLAVDEVERGTQERAAHGRADLADHAEVEVREAAVGRTEEVACGGGWCGGGGVSIGRDGALESDGDASKRGG